MSELYPLLLMPIFDERPWGVRDLRPIYTRVVKEPIGESWLTWEDNRVANGPLAGRTLGELCKQYGRDLVGQAARFDNRFPLLVKFLFPGDKLSVQVHPDDEQAQQDRPALRKDRMLVCVARTARRSSCAGIEARRDVWSNSNRQLRIRARKSC